MTHILHRQLARTPPVAVSGHGITIVDSEGREYLDASGGAAVSCLGHGHPDVIAAMHAQIDKLAYAHTSFFTSEPAEALADHLLAAAPPGSSHVYFVSGGSEAMEAALKLARQYFVEIGQPQRRQFVARRQSYHGNTLGALAVGGNEWRRRQFAPLLIDVAHVSPCYEYRDRRDDETPEAYGERLAQELETTLQRLGPETVIAFVAEIVGGATSGAIPPVPGYFRRVKEVCERHGVLLIADEVMCGMGRTGALYASTQEGIAPDLIAIAKGLGGGYQPIGAVVVQKKIVEALERGSGLFQHGHTYLGHPVACAAALAVQRVIVRDRLLEAVGTLGARLARRLHERFDAHASVGDIRGRGLFMAIELVADRASKRPFDPSLKLHARIKAEAMARGLMVYPSGGTIDGRLGDHVLLAPPFISTPEEIDEIVHRLGASVDAAIDGLAGTREASAAQTQPA
ncbi:MAG: aspartate aminotransferase family protein [Caldimonas sp.]